MVCLLRFRGPGWAGASFCRHRAKNALRNDVAAGIFQLMYPSPGMCTLGLVRYIILMLYSICSCTCLGKILAAARPLSARFNVSLAVTALEIDIFLLLSELFGMPALRFLQMFKRRHCPTISMVSIASSCMAYVKGQAHRFHPKYPKMCNGTNRQGHENVGTKEMKPKSRYVPSLHLQRSGSDSCKKDTQ